MSRNQFLTIVLSVLFFQHAAANTGIVAGGIVGGAQFASDDPLKNSVVKVSVRLQVLSVEDVIGGDDLTDSLGLRGKLREFSCSGVLIDRDIVLTAAHCFKTEDSASQCNRGRRTVYTLSGIEVSGENGFKSAAIHRIHPAYNHRCSTELERDEAPCNDLALLALRTPSSSFTPLASQAPPPGARTIAAGYGYSDWVDMDSCSPPPPSNIRGVLQKVPLTLQPRPNRWSYCLGSSCASERDSARAGVEFGDSGGPVFFSGRVSGIVRAAAPGRALITDTAPHLSWIDREKSALRRLLPPRP